MAVSMLMVTACNSKIKVDYGYNPTDYVELGDYKGITADVDVTAITNKVVEDKISEQMDDQTTYTDVNRGAQKSDKVTFSYSGTSGGLAVGREKNFIYYSLNASVLEEVLLWLQDLKGEGKK